MLTMRSNSIFTSLVLRCSIKNISNTIADTHTKKVIENPDIWFLCKIGLHLSTFPKGLFMFHWCSLWTWHKMKKKQFFFKFSRFNIIFSRLKHHRPTDQPSLVFHCHFFPLQFSQRILFVILYSLAYLYFKCHTLNGKLKNDNGHNVRKKCSCWKEGRNREDSRNDYTTARIHLLYLEFSFLVCGEVFLSVVHFYSL